MKIIVFLLVKLQPIASFQRQATAFELERKDVKNVKVEFVRLTTNGFHVQFYMLLLAYKHRNSPEWEVLCEKFYGTMLYI